MIALLPINTRIVVTAIRPARDVDAAGHVYLQAASLVSWTAFAELLSAHLDTILEPLPERLLPGPPAMLVVHLLFPNGRSTAMSAWFGIDRAIKRTDLRQAIAGLLPEFSHTNFAAMPEELIATAIELPPADRRH
jgi:hypothetical protein